MSLAKSAGTEMKARLRADLRAAMKSRNTTDAQVIRSLVAALDNAEAPALSPERPASEQHQFASRSAEVARLQLTWPQVHEVLLGELQERERAAAEFARLNQPERATTLRTEASVITRYLD